MLQKIRKLSILTNIFSHPKLNCSGLVPGTLVCLQSYKNKKNGKVKILLDTSKREKKNYTNKTGKKYVRYFHKTKLTNISDLGYYYTTIDLITTWISNLVRTTPFWNNLH